MACRSGMRRPGQCDIAPNPVPGFQCQLGAYRTPGFEAARSGIPRGFHPITACMPTQRRQVSWRPWSPGHPWEKAFNPGPARSIAVACHEATRPGRKAWQPMDLRHGGLSNALDAQRNIGRIPPAPGRGTKSGCSDPLARNRPPFRIPTQHAPLPARDADKTRDRACMAISPASSLARKPPFGVPLHAGLHTAQRRLCCTSIQP